MEALTHIDAEKTVLGCVLSDSESTYRVLPLLKANDFSLDSHRRIYHAIAELAEAGKPVDELTLTDALFSKGQLESVGGVGYVTSLSYRVDVELARATNVEHYAGLIIDKSRRRQAHLAAECLSRATEDTSVSTDECLQSVQEALLQIEAASGTKTARHVRDFMPEVLRELETQASNQGLVGMSTGIHGLDLATGGIRAGELWTIGALPGKGKTALGVQIMLAGGMAGTPTYAFSLEMQDLEIGKRFLAAKSSLPAMQIRNPQTIRKDRWADLLQSAADVAACPIYVDDRPSLKIQELLASARLYIRRHGVTLIVVDYLRLVDAPGRELRDRVGYVANALRQLAKTERIGVVLLSQLRRPEGEINARPSMLDLKESGDIEAHSHVVLLPYMPVGDDGRTIPEGGESRTIQKAKQLAPVCEQYKTRKSVQSLAQEELSGINQKRRTPTLATTMDDFVARFYFPFVEAQKRPSTAKGYHDMWEDHFQFRCESVLLRDVRTCTIQQWLEAVAAEDRTKTGRHLSHETMKHLKSLLSGIFAHAKRRGFFDGVNPVMDTAIPPSPKGGDTYAYSLEEIRRMLMVLPEPAVSIVATAAFTSARRGEIRGMLWENYRDGAIYVNHSVWESHVTEPKTKASKAPVPVIAPLAAFLRKHCERLGNPSSGMMFPAVNGKPISLNNVLNRQIRVALERCVVCGEGKRKHGPEVEHKFELDETRPQWHGWHAFRRGLATNLYRLGVPDKTIQAILRHSNLSTTQNIYIKTVDGDSVAAMQTLEALMCATSAPEEGRNASVGIN